jgi:NAD(P)-dependent dehydrogenase (short-subunit alcohol dehydrogenase family)
MGLLDGKTALITGVDLGIDCGIALALAAARAKVAVNDLGLHGRQLDQCRGPLKSNRPRRAEELTT